MLNEWMELKTFLKFDCANIEHFLPGSFPPYMNLDTLRLDRFIHSIIDPKLSKTQGDGGHSLVTSDDKSKQKGRFK